MCDLGAVAPAPVLGASWDADDTIVYSEIQKGIMRISASGGIPETMIPIEDGKSVVFTCGSPPYQIAVQSIKSKKRKVLFPGDNAWYLPTGHMIYTLDNSLYAVPFDLKTLQPGASVPLIEGIFRAGGPPQYAVSDSGTLAYVPGTADAAGGKPILVWVDQNGREEPLAAQPNDCRGPRISPDGTKVAFSIFAGNKSDIWI